MHPTHALAAGAFELLILDCDGVVEDSPSGAAAALAAGMSVYGYCADASDARLLTAGAHKVFRRMAELPALVAGVR